MGISRSDKGGHRMGTFGGESLSSRNYYRFSFSSLRTFDRGFVSLDEFQPFAIYSFTKQLK